MIKIALDSDYKKSLLYLTKWIIIAIIAGTVGTSVVQLFAYLLETISSYLLNLQLPLPLWTILGAIITGALVYRIEPGASGEGIPSYLNGIRYNEGKLSFSQTFFKFWAALATLSTFGNGGLVGPLGRVSSGLMSSIGKKIKILGFSDYDIRTSAICGLAATVGAIFHTSVGGGIFAVEIIQKSEMRYSDLFPSILASSTAVYICKVFGWETFYPIKAVDEFMDVKVIGWLVILAILSGLLGKSYTNFYAILSKLLRRKEARNILLKVVIGSLVASLFAWIVNSDLLGTSKNIIASLFSHDNTNLFGNLSKSTPVALILVIMLIVKATTNCITVGSGMSAGFTGPAVIIGMLLGAFIANSLGIDNSSASYSAFIAAGFSGVLASSMNIPIAAAVMTIEIFGLQYSFPAGLAAVVGFQVNRHNTIYDYALVITYDEENDNYDKQ